MNRKILSIAIPSIVSNVTIPLLALADTAIVGHLGAASYIGAIALGGMIFSMAYWLFGFLRMGTGGLTAQAYGAGNRAACQLTLLRSLMMAVGIGAALIALQWPIVNLTFRFVTATPEVESAARCYFGILIWGAPAVLSLYSFTGWFLGMQNARIPMLIAIVQNVVNVVVSLFLVMVCGLKVEGVALGTLFSQWLGAGIAFVLWRKRFRTEGFSTDVRILFDRRALLRFFGVNRDIFLRTLCLISVTTYFTSAGSSQGELTLAANTLLMQFYMFFSYVADGFAYSGEALGGRYCGAADAKSYVRLTRRLFLWGAALALIAVLVYAVLGHHILRLLTNEPDVLAEAGRFFGFVLLVPPVSIAAFLFDGLFIGATATRQMLLSMAVAVAVFFATVHAFAFNNHLLWTAYLLYLGVRGLVQWMLFGGIVRRIGQPVSTEQ